MDWRNAALGFGGMIVGGAVAEAMGLTRIEGWVVAAGVVAFGFGIRAR